ncbi:MAG: exonuclease [Chloroflexota bacterium]|jgi:ribonuclease J|nr:exonuclease [Chloroflexota bacterium]MDP6757520.1 exonuclease [Chloroflexota bacterium]
MPDVACTLFGGNAQIGGNKILLRDGGIDLFLDFGMNFEANGRYFAEFLSPRGGTSGTYDYLMMGIIPPVSGIYRSDAAVEALDPIGWQEARRKWGEYEAHPTALLLSHAHVDHTGHIAFLDGDIPIVASAVSAQIVKSMQDTAAGGLDTEVAYWRERIDDPDRNRLGYLEKQALAIRRPWLITDYGNWSPAAEALWNHYPGVRGSITGPDPAPFSGKVASLAVRDYPVDHSIPGARAFAIETSAGWVVYTGDLRLHGATGHQTLEFAEAVRELNPVALLCEGTRVSDKPSRPANEDIVRDRSREAVAATDGLVVADFGPRNIERLRIFLDIARDNDRKLVVLARDAHLLRALHASDPSVPLPDPAAGLYVFRDREGATRGWKKDVMERNAGASVNWEDVAAFPGEYLLCLSVYDLTRLIDINPTGGAYIYSTSEPYDLQMELSVERLRSWVRRFNLTLVGDPEIDTPAHSGFHAGGHAPGEDIFKVIEIINPRLLIPIHTLYPDLMAATAAELNIPAHMPEFGVPVPIG